MPKPNNEATEIHECQFEAHILQANAKIRFPCKLFVAWKTNTNKTFAKTENDNVRLKDCIAVFNETLRFQTYLLYDSDSHTYFRKETSLTLLLVSMRKPDEEKLVGRITVNLAEVLNEKAYEAEQSYALSFCSVQDATLSFNIKVLRAQKTDMKPFDLDMEQFSIVSAPSRAVNQSSSSNNDDLLHFKNQKQESILKEQKITIKHEEIGRQLKQKEGVSSVKSNNLTEERAVEEGTVKERAVEEGTVEGAIEEGAKEKEKEKASEQKQKQKQIKIEEVETERHRAIQGEGGLEIKQETPQQVQTQISYKIVEAEMKEENKVEQNKQTGTENIENENSQAVQTTRHQQELERDVNREENKLAKENMVKEQNEQIVQQLSNPSPQQVEEDSAKIEPAQEYAATPIRKSGIFEHKSYEPQTPRKPEQMQQQVEEGMIKMQSPPLIQSKLSGISNMSGEYPDSIQLEIQRRQFLNNLLNQNSSYKQVLASNDLEIKELKNARSSLIKQVDRLNENIANIQIQKNDIVQELLSQIQTETELKISAQSELKQLKELTPSWSQQQTISALQQKLRILEEQLEGSEKLRFEAESQILQARFEMSELKLEQENYEKIIKGKTQEIQKLKKRDENGKGKEENAGTDEVEKLNSQINKLMLEAEESKKKMSQLTFDYEEICVTRDKYYEELQNLTEEQIANEEEMKKLKNRMEVSNGGRQEEGDLTRELDSVKSQLLESQQRYRAKSEELSRIKQENQSMQRIIQDREKQTEKIPDMLKELDNLQTEYQRALNQISQKDLGLKSIEKYLIKKDEEIAELQSKCETKITENKKIEAQARKLEEDIKKLQIQLKQCSKQKEDFLSVQANYESKIGELGKSKIELNNKIIRLENDISNFTFKIEKLQKDLKAREATIGEKNKMIDLLSAQVEDEMRKVHELEERIGRFSDKEMKMRENILILEEESRKIYEIVLEKEENEDFQNQIIDEKEETAGQLKMQLEEAKEKCQKLEEEVGQLKKQIFQLKISSVNHQDGGSPETDKNEVTTTQQLERYQQFLDLSNQRITELEQQILKKQKQHTERVSALNQKISKLSSQKIYLQKEKISALEQERNDLKKQKNELGERIRRLQFMLEENEAKVKSVEEEKQSVKANSQKNIEFKKIENQELLKRIEALEKQNREYEIKANDYRQRIQKVEVDREMEKVSGKTNDIQNFSQSSKASVSRQENKKLELVHENQILKSKVNDLEGVVNKLKMEAEVRQNAMKNLNDSEENSAEEINAELDKHFRIAEKKQNNQGGEVVKKSSSKDHGKTASSEVIEACKSLQKLLKQRENKEKSESIIELLISKNAMMEESFGKISQERGVIQENARKLSMQFQKVKAKILKGKGSFQQKNQLLSNFKPCEAQVRDLIELSEKLSDLQYEMEND